MRRIAAKRRGGGADVPLDGLPAPVADERLLGIHEVLARLKAEDEIKARIVKLRFFSGMGHDEIAALPGVNEKTVRRPWALAKIRLYRAIEKKIEIPCPFFPPLHACITISPS